MTKWERAELIALAQKEVLEVNFVKKKWRYTDYDLHTT